MSSSQVLLAERLVSHAHSGPRPRQNLAAEAGFRFPKRARHSQVFHPGKSHPSYGQLAYAGPGSDDLYSPCFAGCVEQLA